MKKVLAIITMCAASITAMAQAQFTADYYKADPAKYLNKVVTVFVSSCKPSSFVAIKGYVSYYCFTEFHGTRGGLIYVLVPEKKSRFFFRNYGDVKSAVGKGSSSKPIKAKFTSVKWDSGAEEYVLIIQ